MAEEGVLDHQSAKTKAIERLGLPENAARPDNREIEFALIEHLQLFEAKELGVRRKHWRQTALEAMKLLRDFSPQLIGAALSGTVTRFSRVQLLVATSPESIAILLHDHEIPFDQAQRRLRRSTKDHVYLPVFRFLVDDVNIEIICVETEARSRALLCPISGKPFQRAGLREVEQLADAQIEPIPTTSI